MSDLLYTGVAWLVDRLAVSVSHVVTYVRGTERLTLSASFGRTGYQVMEGVGEIRTTHTDRDFLIAADNLVLAGVKAEPAVGDKIEEMVSSTIHTYQVMAPEGQGQPFYYCDQNRVMMRIHTKLISIL